MQERNGLFHKRDNSWFRPAPSATPTPAPAPVVIPPPEHTSKSEQPKVEAKREAKLVVGPQIKMKGAEISDCDTLVVEGRMEATLDSRVLEITEHGVFHGTIGVDQAEIHGRFEGELTVRKQLTIHGTGKVSGKIRYARIKVEEGAELAGDVVMQEKAPSAIAPAKGPLGQSLTQTRAS